MGENYLCHYGILGQKWGVRRYQNADGTLTDAGKKRYDSYSTSDEHGGTYLNSKNVQVSKDGKMTQPHNKNSYVNSAMKPGNKNEKPSSAEKIMSNTKEGITSAKELNNKVIEMSQRSTSKQDLSQYSDKELQEMINRMRLEEQYTQYVSKQDVSSGAQKVKDVLDIASSGVGLAASVVGVAAAIYKITHGNGGGNNGGPD